MTTQRMLLLALSLSSAGCYDPPANSMDGTTSSPEGGTQADTQTEDGSTSIDLTMPASTGEMPSTSSETTDTTATDTTADDTGGCMPGVFGSSVFSDACFQ